MSGRCEEFLEIDLHCVMNWDITLCIDLKRCLIQEEKFRDIVNLNGRQIHLRANLWHRMILLKIWGLRRSWKIVECLDKQLQFNIMNIINDVSSSMGFIHRKNQAHKTLGTYQKKHIVCFGQLYFSLDKLSIALYVSFWQVKI